jgi:DNA-binding beta-propeller fold protein YncE
MNSAGPAHIGGDFSSGVPGGGVPPASSRSLWIKLVVAFLLTVGLVWALLLAVQYWRTRKPIPELPAVPPQVAGLFEEPPSYVGSLYGVERPLGVAVGPDGTVYVTETGAQRQIHVFDADGTEIASFAPPGTTVPGRVPVYVAVSPDGQVYVSDRDANTIYIFSPDGTLVGEVPAPQGEEWHPLGLAFDAQGNLYVTDVTPGQHRLLVFSPAGDLILEIGTEGSEEGEFWFPNAIAVDDQGRIYVSDSNNGRVQVFDRSGSFLYQIGRGLARGDLSLPRGIAIDDQERLFVVDTSRQQVQVYDISGSGPPQFVRSFGAAERSGGFSYPNGVALADDGLVYVTDRENNRVQIWRYR